MPLRQRRNNLEQKELIYYKSRICPKCIPTSRFLKKFREEYPDVSIREVEVLFHMKSAREAKIHSIPVILLIFWDCPHRENKRKVQTVPWHIPGAGSPASSLLFTFPAAGVQC